MDRAQIISYANHIESTHGVLTRGLLVSLIIQESNFDIWAAGKAGELGLTQIMPANYVRLSGTNWQGYSAFFN